jgi:hypothetical protein
LPRGKRKGKTEDGTPLATLEGYENEFLGAQRRQLGSLRPNLTKTFKANRLERSIIASSMSENGHLVAYFRYSKRNQEYL